MKISGYIICMYIIVLSLFNSRYCCMVRENEKRRSSRSGYYHVMQRACNSLRCTLHRALPTSSHSLRLVLRLSKKKRALHSRFRKIRQRSIEKWIARLTRKKKWTLRREQVGREITCFSNWLRGWSKETARAVELARKPIYFDIYCKKYMWHLVSDITI